MSKLDLSGKELFLFDLDGVFYKGKESRVKLGGSLVIDRIRSQGKKLFVLTNNSTDTVEKLHSNLVQFGIRVKKDEILTSGRLTAEYIANEYGKASYFLVGEEGFERELRRCGHRRVRGPKADVVAIGLDRFVTYAKLDAATRVAREGADLVASHAARIYMSGAGAALGPGAIVRALEFATQKRATTIGKPSPLMFRIALRKAGCGAREAVMVGDQLDTDVAGAARVGIDSILVLTGIDKSIAGTPALAKFKNVDELAKLI